MLLFTKVKEPNESPGVAWVTFALTHLTVTVRL